MAKFCENFTFYFSVHDRDAGTTPNKNVKFGNSRIFRIIQGKFHVNP